MLFQMLYSRTSTGAVQTWQIETQDNKYRTKYGQLDGLMQTTEWTICKGKNIGKANATTDNEQAIKEAQSIYDKKIASGYHESISNIDKHVFTEPMLAKKYEDYADKLVYPVYSQPKLDGIRCVIDSKGMWSRNGKPIISAPHIFLALKDFFIKYPSVILDGELYCDKFANDFNQICSLVKRTKPTQDELNQSAESIQYWVYDLISNDNFLGRLSSCTLILPVSSKIVIVPTVEVRNKARLDELYEYYVSNGYEGQIIRTNDKYENKRSKNLLKRKEFQDAEYVILDITEGEGNRSGMAGNMIFKNPSGTHFKSNIKGDRKYLKYLLDNRSSYIGKQATIKYFNLTPDGIPRFPFVIKIDRDSYE